MSGEIKIECANSIAEVVISRPEKLNSVTYEMLVSFDREVSGLANDPDVMAIVVRGDGEKAFSAGFDLEMIRGLRGRMRYDFFKILESTIGTLRQARNCLTVAAVSGYAVGFGAMVASACDFRFFTETASFRLPEVDIGVFPAAGASSNLIHLVGPSRAKDIILTGRTITADEALRIGLADRVVAQAELRTAVLEFVEQLVKKDRKIIMRAKTLIDGMIGKELGDAAETESVYLEEWLRELGSGPD